MRANIPEVIVEQIFDEQRIDNISQNGGDGLHYPELDMRDKLEERCSGCVTTCEACEPDVLGLKENPNNTYGPINVAPSITATAVIERNKEWEQLVTQKDDVNHPEHYTSHPSGIEIIQITESMGFCLGNAVKYIMRCELKGNKKQDLEKALWYINRELEKV